jgi:hypothetical protein
MNKEYSVNDTQTSNKCPFPLGFAACCNCCPCIVYVKLRNSANASLAVTIKMHFYLHIQVGVSYMLVRISERVFLTGFDFQTFWCHQCVQHEQVFTKTQIFSMSQLQLLLKSPDRYFFDAPLTLVQL